MARRKDASPPAGVGETILPQAMEDVIHQSMMPYAEYVILDRALPRVEDGLKPVQRRILYTMYELGLTPDKPHRKCARIVGDTLGKYHPHGDTSVYDALVRMAQPFNMNAPLVDGHGNFGSIDGDSAAAMRYTEARLTPLAMELLRDIEKDTVQYSFNFDDTLKEPDMLPGRFPNLLVNGASGIAVGLATNIPPHNLGEVIDAVIAQIDNPKITTAELMRHIKGPDFPTGGFLLQSDEIIKAFETGRGRLQVRAKTAIEPAGGGKRNIVITELPYQVNKAALLTKILKLSEEKKGVLTGIADIRDESDRTGMRAVIEVRKDADAEKILQYLFKYSDLQVTFGANIVAIADGKPQQLGVYQINAHYINYQKTVLTRRLTHDLENAKAREHVLAGLIIAVNNLDLVIRLIRSSATPKEAREKLVKALDLTEIQAQAILDLRLQRLTGLEIESLRKEYAEILKLIRWIEGILASEKKLLALLKQELGEIKERHAQPRRTQILGEQAPLPDAVEFKVVEEASIIVTSNGYAKRMPTKLLQRTDRAAEPAQGEHPSFIVDTATDRALVAFTDRGMLARFSVEDVPECKWKDRGTPLARLVANMSPDERVVALLDAQLLQEEGAHLLFYTKSGMIKRTAAGDCVSRVSRIQAINLKGDDSLINVELLARKTKVLFVTQKGMAIAFKPEDVSAMGRVAAGVRAIALAKGDQVIAAMQITDEGEIVLLSDRGYAKRCLAVDFDAQNRGGKGGKAIDLGRGAAGGALVAAFYVREPYELLIEQKDGQQTRLSTEDIPLDVRASRGRPVVMVLADNVVAQAWRLL